MLSHFFNWREPFPGMSIHKMQWVQSGGGLLIAIPSRSLTFGEETVV
jgi:hypothetical protein